MVSIGINALGIGKKQVGTGRYAYQLINHITEIDSINQYIIIANQHLHLGKGAKSNVKYVHFKFQNKLLRITIENGCVPHLVKKQKIDIYHSPFFTIPYLISSPSVITIHDAVFCKFPETIQKSRRLYLNAAIKHSILKSNRIIAVSQNTKKDILELFNVPEKKIDVVYLASSSCFKPIVDPERVKKTCKTYSITQPFILFVGKIDPRKNVSRLFQAFGMLKKEKKIGHKLVITGQLGWNSGNILSKIQSLSYGENIITTGYISEDELVDLYHGADLFVLPSLYEGFGLPILEAMACGTPVITSNVSSMPEIAGDAAILVDPYDTKALSEAMYEIITKKSVKNELIEKGFERVKHFSWERCAAETMRVYEKAVSS